MRLIRSTLLVATCLLAACAPGEPSGAAGASEDASAPAVTIEAIAFDPPTLDVSVGDTVTWTNRDAAVKHTVTSGMPGDKGVPGLDQAKPDKPDGVFDGPLADDGDTFEFTFTEQGTFEYFCRVHPVMTARIVVSS